MAYGELSWGISSNFTRDAATMATCGGLLLGFTVLYKLGLIGEILGVSGSVRSCCSCKSPYYSVFFLWGLVMAGYFFSNFVEGDWFEEFPKHKDSSEAWALNAQLGLGALLVGFGTSMGNGCTSGHGLTGLARLSVRSLVAVPTFMISAMIAATFLGTASVLPEDIPYLPVVVADPPSHAGERAAHLLMTEKGAGLGILSLLVTGAMLSFGGSWEEHVGYQIYVVELISGFVFGMGLTLSTMVRPSKVAAFVDLGSGAWDPSLAFVMGGALLVTFPAYQWIHYSGIRKSLLDLDFKMPPLDKPVTRRLILGEVLFGIGWGICGMCPGPIMVYAGAKPCYGIWCTLLGMFTGALAYVHLVPPEESCEVAAKEVSDDEDSGDLWEESDSGEESNSDEDESKPL